MPANTARLLIADDQPDVLEALRWLLTGEGYQVELVSSTEAVLDLMSNLQAAVRAFALEAVSPASINNSVNRLLCRSMASGRFATFCYARIEPAAGRIVYSNAGHNPPLLIRPGGVVEQLSEGGMVLGVFPDIQYEQAELPLDAGDRLLFYTDGITEARSPGGEEYGEDRLAAVALGARTSPAATIKDAILADVNGFTHGSFEDDATLIVVGIA